MAVIVVDAFEMGVYRDCARKFDLRIRKNMVTKGQQGGGRSFGSVLHKGREMWRRAQMTGKPNDLALVAGLTALDTEHKNLFGTGVMTDERRSLTNARALFTGYTAKYSLQPYKPIHVEIPFKLFVGHSPGGHEVWRSGILDEYCEFNGRTYVLDFKTSTVYPGSGWFDGWRTSDQFMGYLWASRQLLGATHGVIVHGVWVHTPAKTSRAKYKFEDYFTSDIITFSDGQLEEWKEHFLDSVDKRQRDIEADSFTPAWGSACKAYNRNCDFFKWCTSDPAIRPSIEKIYYDRVKWTPLSDERLTAETEEAA